MNDSSNSSSSTEMNGQMSFDDMTSPSDVAVSPVELLELVITILEILVEHVE